MRLQTDAIDARAVGFHQTDELLGCGGLRASVLDAVVVIVELGGRVCCCGCREGNGDVGFSYGLVEDVVAVGAVVIQGCLLAWSVQGAGH